MAQAANLRDILSLARMLRSLADGYTHESTYDQLVSVAAELEARARFLATEQDPSPASIAQDTALHAPVDLKV